MSVGQAMSHRALRVYAHVGLRYVFDSRRRFFGMTTKTIDAVALKCQGAARIHAQISQMSKEQQLAYWQERTQELLAQQHAQRTSTPMTAITAS